MQIIQIDTAAETLFHTYVMENYGDGEAIVFNSTDNLMNRSDRNLDGIFSSLNLDSFEEFLEKEKLLTQSDLI